MMDVKPSDNKKIIIKSSIFGIIFLIVYLVSLINSPRIILYCNIFGSLKILIIALYFFMLLFSLVFCVYSIIYIIIYKDRDSSRLSSLYNIRKILDIPNFLSNCFSIIFFIAIFIVTPCNVSGASMEGTYHNNDKILCSNLFYTPKVDDVVVFDSTNYADTKGVLFIKRVLAVENDILYYNKDEKILYVNDEKAIIDLSLSEYLYIINNDTIDYPDTYVIPRKKLLVIGDNRKNSKDSRSFGLIDEKDVFGKVFLKIYPFSKTVKNIKE